MSIATGPKVSVACLSVVWMTLWATAASGQNASLKPGETTRIEAPGRSGFYLVNVPRDYTPDRAWPVLLFYHGYNGKPGIGPLHRVLEGKHFIIVGMDYASQAYHESFVARWGVTPTLANAAETFVNDGSRIDVSAAAVGLTACPASWSPAATWHAVAGSKPSRHTPA